MSYNHKNTIWLSIGDLAEFSFENEEKETRKKQEATKNKVMKDVQSKISKSTLGDIDALSDLKNKIDDK